MPRGAFRVHSHSTRGISESLRGRLFAGAHTVPCYWGRKNSVGLIMYKVVVSSVGGSEVHTFPDKPRAMNCAVRILKKENGEIKVTIEDACGIVFAHDQIARASDAVRL